MLVSLGQNAPSALGGNEVSLEIVARAPGPFACEPGALIAVDRLGG